MDEPVEKESDIQKEELIKVTSKVPLHVLDLLLKSTRKLNAWQSIQVAQVLIDFEGMFSKHDLDLGLFTEIQHQINTQDAKPIKKTGHQNSSWVPRRRGKDLDRNVECKSHSRIKL